MLFYTPIYLFIFFPLVLYFYYNNCKSDIFKKIFLIFSSLIFYSYWDINFLPLIIFSILMNYFFYKLIKKSIYDKKKKLWLSILLNLLILILFKYTNFIIDNINIFFNSSINNLNLPFPLAISFFTFQSIVFLINVYDNEVDNVKFFDFFLFISFFPQLVAGPIVKFNEMINQFNDNTKTIFNNKYFYFGLTILIIGFIKKTIFADTLGIYVDELYSNINYLNSLSAWLLSLSFTFQFYFDFSGYVDMAVGSALMLNIKLPQNFNSPLKANSIIDFWHKWHITLSNFLNNFVFMPWIMSVKKINFFKTMSILLIVFILAGLWHGPAWTFIFFGFIHGIGLIINHSFRKYFNININHFISWLITFNYINISFLMFRSYNVNDFLKIFKKMFEFNFLYNDHLHSIIDLKFTLLFILSIAVCFFFKNSKYLTDKL